MKTVLIKIVGVYLNLLSIFSSKYAAKKALNLFSRPRKGAITKDQFTFLNTSVKEKLFYKDNTVMTYHWLGNKQTVLLAHGWESNAARWILFINAIHKLDYSIIALDAPAHGMSGSKNFNALLYAEFINVVVKKFNPNILIGHSVGGMATVFSYHKYQFTNIDKMILLGAPSELKDVFKRYVDMMQYNKSIEKQINNLVFERFGKYPNYFSTAKFLKEATFKGLIIHDENDDIIPFEDALLIKNSFKNSTLISTKELGHSLNHKSVITYISEFIDN